MPGTLARYRRYARYGTMAYRAARTIGRAYKRYNRYKKRRGGRLARGKRKYQRLSAPSAKRRCTVRQTTDDAETLLDVPIQNLVIIPIEFGPQRGTGNGVRNHNTVTLKGIHICENMLPDSFQSVNSTVEVHWALCQLKAPLEEFSDNVRGSEAGLIKDYIKDRFFRNNSAENVASGIGNTTRPFIDANGTISTPWDWLYTCDPLNTELFNVLARKKRIVTTESAQSNATGAWIWKWNKYFKMNKRFAFHNEDDVFGRLPFFTCVWYTTVDPRDYSGFTGGVPVQTLLRRATNYQTWYS